MINFLLLFITPIRYQICQWWEYGKSSPKRRTSYTLYETMKCCPGTFLMRAADHSYFWEQRIWPTRELYLPWSANNIISPSFVPVRHTQQYFYREGINEAERNKETEARELSDIAKQIYLPQLSFLFIKTKIIVQLLVTRYALIIYLS